MLKELLRGWLLNFPIETFRGRAIPFLWGGILTSLLWAAFTLFLL